MRIAGALADVWKHRSNAATGNESTALFFMKKSDFYWGVAAPRRKTNQSGDARRSGWGLREATPDREKPKAYQPRAGGARPGWDNDPRSPRALAFSRPTPGHRTGDMEIAPPACRFHAVQDGVETSFVGFPVLQPRLSGIGVTKSEENSHSGAREMTVVIQIYAQLRLFCEDG